MTVPPTGPGQGNPLLPGGLQIDGIGAGSLASGATGQFAWVQERL